MKIAVIYKIKYSTYQATASLYTKPAEARRTTSKQRSDPSILKLKYEYIVKIAYANA